MDTALTQKFPFILDRNLAKANGTENHLCTSCDKVVLGLLLIFVGQVACNPVYESILASPYRIAGL